MKKKQMLALFLTLFFAALGGCATAEHTGRVQDVNDGQAVLRLSSADTATTGQAFEAYRYQRIMYGNPSKQPIPTYKRETVGCLQVTEVVDSHHAKASVMHGDVEARDLVQPGGASCPLPGNG